MKLIRLDVSKDDLKDETKLLEAVRKAMEWHFRLVVPYIDVDDAQYDGITVSQEYAKRVSSSAKLIVQQQQETTSITTPKAKYIVDTSSALFVGVPPEISIKGNKTEKKNVNAFNDKLIFRNFPRTLYNDGKGCSKYGIGFILEYVNDGDNFPRFAYLNLRYTNVVFDCSIEGESLFGFTFSEQHNVVKGVDNAFYRIYVYTEDAMTVVDTSGIGSTAGIADYNVQFFSPANGKKFVQHSFGKVPLTMFINNEQMVGDARPVYGLIDAYNDLQTNRLQNVQDIIDYVLMLKNVDLGNDTDRSLFKELLKEKVLALKGDNTDAKFLANPLDQKQMSELLKSIEDDIYQVSGVPNFYSETFASNASATALQMKLLNFIYLVNEKERNFTPPLIRIIKMTQNWLKETRNDDGLMFDVEKCRIEYTHNLPSNDQEMIAQIVNLSNAGLLDPQVLRRLSFIGGNVDEYIENAKKYLEEKKEMESKYAKTPESGAVNENNLEKQNKEPVEKNQYDNSKNAVEGDGKKLSVDK